jgi:hypothetical protein
MASKSKKLALEQELDAWTKHAESAAVRIKQIEAELKAVSVPAPPPGGTTLEVEVQFALNPNTYKFVIMSVPGKGYYTTGTLPENSFFATWAKLWDYFNSDDVVRRSEFHVLLPSPFPSNRYGGELDRRLEF